MVEILACPLPQWFFPLGVAPKRKGSLGKTESMRKGIVVDVCGTRDVCGREKPVRETARALSPASHSEEVGDIAVEFVTISLDNAGDNTG